jgi:2-polyprenyl-3-methyl-5-hydroxy-6-metoxy-1,4-benzoquinol methylase
VAWQRYNPDYFWQEYLPSMGITDGQFDLNAFDGHYAQVLRIIQGSRPSGRLLEVGCGAGFLLKAAQRKGWDVVGLEVSAAAVEFVRNSLELEVHQCTIHEAAFPAESFDAVAMFETIEHLFDPQETLQAVYRCLRPGGVIVLSTPNFNAISRYALGKSWSVVSPGEHLFYFTQYTLHRMLMQARFTDICFGRYYAGQDLYQTMNPFQTHEPGTKRNRLYIKFVETIGKKALPYVQGLGRMDHLYCVAKKPRFTVCSLG